VHHSRCDLITRLTRAGRFAGLFKWQTFSLRAVSATVLSTRNFGDRLNVRQGIYTMRRTDLSRAFRRWCLIAFSSSSSSSSPSSFNLIIIRTRCESPLWIRATEEPFLKIPPASRRDGRISLFPPLGSFGIRYILVGDPNWGWT